MWTSTIYVIEHNTLLLAGGVAAFALMSLAYVAGEVKTNRDFTGLDDYWLAEALSVVAGILALASILGGLAGIIHQLL